MLLAMTGIDLVAVLTAVMAALAILRDAEANHPRHAPLALVAFLSAIVFALVLIVTSGHR